MAVTSVTRLLINGKTNLRLMSSLALLRDQAYGG